MHRFNKELEFGLQPIHEKPTYSYMLKEGLPAASAIPFALRTSGGFWTKPDCPFPVGGCDFTTIWVLPTGWKVRLQSSWLSPAENNYM